MLAPTEKTIRNHLDIFSVSFLVIQLIISGLFTSYWNYSKKKNLTTNFTVLIRHSNAVSPKPSSI